ncbi:MAG: DUF2845 domain-containing protein [Gammaproteobacteria bacterium]
MTSRLLVVAILTLVSFSTQAMRCGNHLVREGDSKLEVLRKCGEPTLSEGSGVVEQEDELTTANRLDNKLLLIGRHQSRFSQPVETWHYNCGANRFSRILTFTGPYLTRIETAEQGYGSGGCRQEPPTHSAVVSDPPADASRRVLDAAIEFRTLHQNNLSSEQPPPVLPTGGGITRRQDESGQWHYSDEAVP